MHKTNFIGKEEVAEETMKFVFEKPAGFEYIAGQSVDLVIPNTIITEGKGNMHPFTLSSAPFEKDLFITTRMRDSAYKKALSELEEEDELEFDGPFGDLILHENIKRGAAFLAGGIGITPFYSMVKEATLKELPPKIFLFYSNRRPEDSAYLKELQDLEKENPNLKLVATMTDMKNSRESWSGETGYIDETMIKKYLGDISNPIFYLAGPSPMVKGMRAMLNAMSVSNDDIRTEEFTGY